jgi:hypothetical protein
VSNGSPPDFKFLADQIAAYTRVEWDPKSPQPGQPIFVETIPGILPFVPPDLAGKLGLPTGPVDLLLQALVKVVKFKVHYEVKKDGTTLVKDTDYTRTDLSPANLPDSDPLQALFSIPPPVVLVEDRKAAGITPSKLVLVVTISVEVEGNHGQAAPVTIPLQIPTVTIPIPALLVLTGNDKVFVMGRTGSSVSSVSGVLSTVNSILSTLNSVKNFVTWGAALGLFVSGLTDVINTIESVPTVAGFAFESAHDLDKFSDFDDDANASILLGPVGTQVELFSDTDFDKGNEWSTFTIDKDIGEPTFATGFGILKYDWRGKNWDHDGGDEMADAEGDGNCESCRFI